MSSGIAELVDGLKDGRTDLAATGESMHARMAALYPLRRSMTGDGLRATLDLLSEVVPLVQHEVPSGSTAFDWVVNDEWNLHEAYIADATGRRLVDAARHNLHVVAYSVPVRATLTREELLPHLHSLPDHPDWIPYRTSYYDRTWGFCLQDRVLQDLGEGPFEVVIDAELGPGALTYGEVVLPGDTQDEVVVTSHTCHPSLANDNLSGLVLATELARTLATLGQRRLTYRFVFAPGTIGSIVWLSRNQDVLPRIRHGLVLAGLGGPGPLVYKRTRRGDRGIDDAAGHVVERLQGELRDYSPYGYDERQFNSVGFDLPFGRLSRTPYGEYPEYHTSADDLDYVKPAELSDSLAALLRIVDVLESDRTYRNLSPFGEPQLGKRGVYSTSGGLASDAVLGMLWVLAYADGQTSLLQTAARAGLDFGDLRAAARVLEGVDLLEEV